MRGDWDDGEPQQGFAGERLASACRGAFPGTQLEERGRSSRPSLHNADTKIPAGGLFSRNRPGVWKCCVTLNLRQILRLFSFLLYFWLAYIFPLRFLPRRICITSPTTWCASCLRPSQILKSSTPNLTSTRKDWNVSGSSMKSLLTLMR